MPRLLAGAAVLVAAVIAVPVPAAAEPTAAEAAAWSVQPSSRSGPGNRPFFTYDLSPGGTVADYVAVTNLGTTPLTFHVYGADAFTTAAGGYDLLPATTTSTDAGSWIALGQTTVTVPARSRADIPFTLKVPANATPGDHAAGIVAAITTAAADAAGNTTRLEQRVGTRLYLRVAGDLRPGLRVDGLTAAYSPGWTPFGGTLDLSYTVRNTGNTRTAAGQSIDVEALFGLTAATPAVDPLPEMLPGASLDFRVRVDAPALLRLSAAVALDSPDGATARSSVGVWAWSWYYVVLLVLLTLLIGLLRRWWRTRSTASPEVGEPATADAR
ncbi:DUF916 domain-containing protein [Actinoplanes sp. NPDC051851]|uniref:WxL protein peptidoglycan domain-containing protein n=1 Tax=Actinoplanes sp. NPDC051851 TaxID=3154753 RepID=UPI003440D2A0